MSHASDATLRGAAPERHAPRTLLDALERNAHDDAPFLTFHGQAQPRRYDARAAREDALRWAASLSPFVVRGEPVAILLPTSTDFVGALLGAMYLGCPPLPLAAPMTFGPVDRYVAHLARIVEHAGARAVVTSARVAKALSELPIATSLRAVLVPEHLDRPRGAVPDVSVAPSDTALLQYTSGTTGRPKGVRISHRALAANTAAIADSLSLGPSDVGVSWLPLYHDMGLVGALLTTISFPYELHVMAPEAFVIRPRKWLELVHTHRATISTAPNFAYDLAAKKANADGLDLSSWRLALDGAEPVHASTLARFHERFGAAGLAREALTPVYGLAEATLAVTFHPTRTPLDVLEVDRDALDRLARAVAPTSGSSSDRSRTLVGVGGPVPGTEIRILRDDGSTCGLGEVGEIAVRGPGLMDGYHRDDEASARSLVDGWLRTGDLGLVERERLFITGRRRELIIQAGRNVHPEDVEEIARECDPRITTAAAFSITASARGTDQLVVALEARGVAADERTTLADAVRGEVLAAIGIRADDVVFWPVGTIPRTTSGKVQRKGCAASYDSMRDEAAGTRELEAGGAR
ncbi:MAG: AMP-binding protein [Sandaracinus sp.]